MLILKTKCRFCNSTKLSKDQYKRTEAGYRNKLQTPWSSCLRWWLTTRDSLKNCINHCGSYEADRVWRDNNISLRSNVKLMRSLVNFIFLYAYESWALTEELEKRTQAFEMRCYRKLLNISYEDHITNEEVRKKSEATIGEYEELLTLDKKRKLINWLRLKVSWFSKDDPTGRSERKRRRGRQKKRWEDNIKEWTGVQLGQLKTGQGGKGLLWSHLWCPDDLARLWDRIE